MQAPYVVFHLSFWTSSWFRYCMFLLESWSLDLTAFISRQTTSPIGTFFQVMLVFPDIQRRAKEEIDAVVGSGRLITLDDRPFLPYIEALYREVMRWCPAVPLSVPHGITVDDIYKGYFIPRGAQSLSWEACVRSDLVLFSGTSIISNVWWADCILVWRDTQPCGKLMSCISIPGPSLTTLGAILIQRALTQTVFSMQMENWIRTMWATSSGLEEGKMSEYQIDYLRYLRILIRSGSVLDDTLPLHRCMTVFVTFLSRTYIPCFDPSGVALNRLRASDFRHREKAQ